MEISLLDLSRGARSSAQLLCAEHAGAQVNTISKTEWKKLGDTRSAAGKTATVKLAQRAEVAIGEVGRIAQDFAAQIRFFEAMNPKDAPAVKPMLGKFDALDKATREVTTKEGPEEGDMIQPEDSGMPAGDEADPWLM